MLEICLKRKDFNDIIYTVLYPNIDLENILHKDGLMKVLWIKGLEWQYEKE
jgi:hypothetical protein